MAEFFIGTENIWIDYRNLMYLLEQRISILDQHRNWAAISKLRSTRLEEIHNEAQNENNPSGSSAIWK